MDGLEDCCCESATCQGSTSLGLISIGFWKKDTFGLPASGRPYCDPKYRTLTISVSDLSGTQTGEMVLTNDFRQGLNPGVAAPFVRSTSGGLPAPLGALIRAPGTYYNHSATGMSLNMDVDAVDAIRVRFEFSEPITFADVESAARVLAAQVNWNNIPIGSGQTVLYQSGSIVTGIGDPGTFCGRINGAGVVSWQRYAEYTYPSGTNLYPQGQSVVNTGQFPVMSWGNTGNWPMLTLSARAWQSRIVIPGKWCRFIGSMVRDTGGFPSGTTCMISQVPPTCGQAAFESGSEIGGIIIENVASGFSIIKCGSDCP